jgi:nucleoid-associated protein YgaU
MTGRTLRLLKAVGALTLLVAVICGVPVLLVALDLVPHGLPSVDEVVTALKARDDGGLLQVVMATGAWVSWALFTLSTLAELVGLIRARPVTVLPGLGLFQQPAAALLAAVAVGLTVAPLAAAAAGAGHVRPPLPVPAVVSDAATRGGSEAHLPPTAMSAASTSDEQSRPPARTHEVRRRDTLWALAERYLGDPLRYPEIVKLNQGTVGPDNEILPGTVLVLPADAIGSAPEDTDSASLEPPAIEEITVEPGDTLWDITEEVTGDGRNWREAWEVNRGRAEPGGAVFTDPSLIQPGWTLSIPSPAKEPAPEPPVVEPSQPRPDPTPAPTHHGPPSDEASTASPAPVPQRPAPRARPSTAAAETLGDATTDVPAAAVAGGGVLLAGVSLVALQRYRRRQSRHRNPGRLISTTAPEHLDVERALHAAGSADVVWLDRALRSLVQSLAGVDGGRLPDVIAVCMTDGVLTLVLTSPATEAPQPWTVDASGTRWSVRRGDRLPYNESQRARFFAPFPTLASVGWSTEGEQWLIDLERIGALAVSGSANRGVDLLRFLAAELAHNTWSEMLQVTLVGFGEELTEINPDRLTYSEDADKAIAGLAARMDSVSEAMHILETDVLTGRLRDVAADSWAPQVLLVAPGAAEANADLTALLTAVEQRSERSAVAVALVAGPDQADAARWDVSIDDTGVLRIPALELELRAQQLPAEESSSLAKMLAAAAITGDLPIPPSRGTALWNRYADACGGLRVDRTREMQSEPDVPGDEPPPTTSADSVLPLSTQSYLDRAATTEQDLEALAPVTDDGIRRGVESADPDLDRDLADWADAASPRPKLTLLGPVHVRAQGSLPARNPRRHFYTEIVAYLATRPGGATSERYATALWPDDPDVVGKTKVRQSISVVRGWLGRDPATDTDYLPSGVTAAAAGRYRIDGILVDAELFRRLRVRGLARGTEGIPDLSAALDLVTGRPFDLPAQRQGSAGGYGWLIDENSRLDYEYAAMIVDVAHTVATYHLGAGQPELAAAAAKVALTAGSFEDVPLLDLVAACDALGNRAEADAYVARILANHDAEVEEDLPPRTAEILFRRQRSGLTD